MIIGLCGYKGSGKDTVAAHLIKEHGFQRRAFADPLKRSFAQFFDIPTEWIERLKNDETCFISIGHKNNPTEPVASHMWSPVSEISFRAGLQRYGVESHRDVFGTDFWLNYTLPPNEWYSGKKIVITDCRFHNEAERIKDLGGKLILVTRPGCVGDDHASERPEELPYTHEIINDGTLEELGEITTKIWKTLL